MDREAVIEFLGQVPLLQRLPSSSIRKIAELVQIRRYDSGEYVLREGETGECLYFIWEGEGPTPVCEQCSTEFHMRGDARFKSARGCIFRLKGFGLAGAETQMVMNDVWDAGIAVESENALSCYGRDGYNQILEKAKLANEPDGRHLSAFA